MKKIALGITTLALSLMALPSQAQIFKFEYTDTISNPTVISGLSIGMPVTVTLALDNGGSSLNSQTWTASHLQWVEFDFNNGALLATFTAPFNAGILGIGNFGTDASGLLTLAPYDWRDSSVGTDYTTNIAGTPTYWQLDSSGAYFNTNVGTVDTNKPANDPANWSYVPNAPEPASFALVGLGLAGLAIMRKRRAV